MNKKGSRAEFSPCEEGAENARGGELCNASLRTAGAAFTFRTIPPKYNDDDILVPNALKVASSTEQSDNRIWSIKQSEKDKNGDQI